MSIERDFNLFWPSAVLYRRWVTEMAGQTHSQIRRRPKRSQAVQVCIIQSHIKYEEMLKLFGRKASPPLPKELPLPVAASAQPSLKPVPPLAIPAQLSPAGSERDVGAVGTARRDSEDSFFEDLGALGGDAEWLSPDKPAVTNADILSIQGQLVAIALLNCYFSTASDRCALADQHIYTILMFLSSQPACPRNIKEPLTLEGLQPDTCNMQLRLSSAMHHSVRHKLYARLRCISTQLWVDGRMAPSRGTVQAVLPSSPIDAQHGVGLQTRKITCSHLLPVAAMGLGAHTGQG